MDKTTFVGIYAGKCYRRGYGRKLYEKAIRLTNVTDGKGMHFDTTIVTDSKGFSQFSEADTGTSISFDAVLTNDGRLLYVSNVKKAIVQ